MSGSRNAAWVAAAVVVALLIAAGGWFLMVSPRLDSAARMEREARVEQDRADQLTVQLAALARDFENIEEFRTELATLQVQIPTDAELSAFTRQIDLAAANAGVVVKTLTASTPMSLAVAAPAPQTDDAGAAPVDDGSAAADPTQPPPPPATTPYFVIPVQIMTVGGFDESLAFVQALQEQSARLVLVSNVVSRTGALEGSMDGMPAMGPGTIETTLTAYVFAMPSDGGTVVEEPDEPGEEPTLPFDPAAPNPFGSIG